MTKERRCILHPEMPCPAKSDDDVCLCLHPDALERAVVTSPTEDERLKRLHLLARKIWIDSIKEQCTRKAEHWQWHDETCPFAASQKKRGEAPDVDKRLSDEYSRGWHDGFSSADAGRLEHKLHAPPQRADGRPAGA
jgi:hypothetical protein